MPQAGCLSSLMRALLGSQSLFSTTFTGGPNGGWVWLGPRDAGDIQVKHRRPSALAQKSLFVVTAPQINVRLSTFAAGKTFTFRGEACLGAGQTWRRKQSRWGSRAC